MWVSGRSRHLMVQVYELHKVDAFTQVPQVPLAPRYPQKSSWALLHQGPPLDCEDRVLDGPASRQKGFKGGPYLYCDPRSHSAEILLKST